MSSTSQDKLAASVFALGLYFGFIRREDIVWWADRRITEIDLAPEWLIDLSLSQSTHMLDLTSDLKRLSEGVDPILTCEAVYALLPDETNFNFDQAAALAKRVYRITYQALTADWKKPLLSITDNLADNFAFARAGYGGATEKSAMDSFSTFVQDHRDGVIVDLLKPATWVLDSQVLLKSGEGGPMVHIGLSAWIIQDGNYGDFAEGQEAQFALEFYSENGLVAVSEGPLMADHLAASRYGVRGRVVFVNPEVWVIDFGVLVAFQQQKPPQYAVVGASVEGEIYLGIDPFFYFEQLTFIEGMPFLSYRWVVRSILRDATPWIEVTVPEGRPILTRDRLREAYVPTTQTKAWDEDEGNAEYVLECEMIGGPSAPSSVQERQR